MQLTLQITGVLQETAFDGRATTGAAETFERTVCILIRLLKVVVDVVVEVVTV